MGPLDFSVSAEKKDFELLDRRDLPALKRLKERYYGELSQERFDSEVLKLLRKHFFRRVWDVFFSPPGKDSGMVLRTLLPIPEAPSIEFCDGLLMMIKNHNVDRELRTVSAQYLLKFLPAHPDFSKLVAPRHYLEEALMFYGGGNKEFSVLVRDTLKVLDEERDKEQERHALCGHE